MFVLEPISASTRGKPGCIPLGVLTRPRSCPFGPVRPSKLALRPLLSIHVAVLARLGLYALKTWMYSPGRVCMFLLESIWTCTPRKPGCTPLGVGTRPRSCPIGPVCPINLAVCSMHVPDLAGIGLHALYNLAVRPWASV